MPSYFVNQPNGYLGYFSTIVDNFTYLNLTAEEAYEVAHVEMGEEAARAKVQRGIDDDLTGMGIKEPQPDGLNRWRKCLRRVEMVHGKEGVEQVNATLIEQTLGVPPSPEWYERMLKGEEGQAVGVGAVLELTPERLQLAKAFLERVLNLDPSFCTPNEEEACKTLLVLVNKSL